MAWQCLCKSDNSQSAQLFFRLPFFISLGSISDSTIAGVISVGTHGSGFQTGIIADYVLELRLVVPSGDIVICSRDAHSELFLSALCGIGALGIIVQVKLQVTAKFYLHQLSYPSNLDHVLENLDELVESSDHFRFLWFPHTDYVSVSVTNKINGAFLHLTDIDYHSRRRLSKAARDSHEYDAKDDLLLPLKLSRYPLEILYFFQSLLAILLLL